MELSNEQIKRSIAEFFAYTSNGTKNDPDFGGFLLLEDDEISDVDEFPMEIYDEEYFGQNLENNDGFKLLTVAASKIAHDKEEDIGDVASCKILTKTQEEGTLEENHWKKIREERVEVKLKMSDKSECISYPLLLDSFLVSN